MMYLPTPEHHIYATALKLVISAWGLLTWGLGVFDERARKIPPQNDLVSVQLTLQDSGPAQASLSSSSCAGLAACHTFRFSEGLFPASLETQADWPPYPQHQSELLEVGFMAQCSTLSSVPDRW